MDNGDDRLGQVWHAHRAALINVAFRILGDIGGAEDAVQEAFTRLLRADATTIDDERGWLVVVTSRLCLDQLRSARARLVDPLTHEQLDRVPATGVGTDPADRVTLDDTVRGALLVVLQRLSPAERVVFVMHDVFQIPFDAIGETVGRSPSSCRQLATRARRRLAAETDVDRFRVTREDERGVVDTFIAACAHGDVDALLTVLDPDVAGDGDFGPTMPVPPIAVGAAEVARRTIGFLGHGATLVSHPTADHQVLVYLGRRLLAVLELTIEGDRITHLHADGTAPTLARTERELHALAAG